MARQLVFFVDDDRFFARPWIDRLRDRFDVLHFGDAEDARQAIVNAPHASCIVLDAMMPVPETASAKETAEGIATGLWMLEQIKEFVTATSIPVVMLTNRDPDGFAKQIKIMDFKKGLVRVEWKPDSSPDKLLALVRDLVARWDSESA